MPIRGGVDVLRLTDVISAVFTCIVALGRKQYNYFASRPFMRERVSDAWLARHYRDE